MIVSGEVALGWACGMCEPIEDWEYVNPPCFAIVAIQNNFTISCLGIAFRRIEISDCVFARATIKVISTHAP